MSSIELTDQVARDFKCVIDHLLQYESTDAESRIDEILQAIRVLETNPHIGKSVGRNEHELVIGRRSHGYVALYRYIAEMDLALVLAIRTQREAGYANV